MPQAIFEELYYIELIGQLLFAEELLGLISVTTWISPELDLLRLELRTAWELIFWEEVERDIERDDDWCFAIYHPRSRRQAWDPG